MKTSIQSESRKGDDSLERPDLDRLLTPTEVAAITSLSIETLAQWRSQRRGIPFVKISRNVVRYRKEDLDFWISGRIVCVDVDAP
jgi:hypothetical protein